MVTCNKHSYMSLQEINIVNFNPTSQKPSASRRTPNFENKNSETVIDRRLKPVVPVRLLKKYYNLIQKPKNFSCKLASVLGSVDWPPY